MNNTSSNFNKMDKSMFAKLSFDGVTPSNQVSNQKSSYADNYDEGDSLDDRSEESGYKNAEDYLKSHIRNYYAHNLQTKNGAEFERSHTEQS